MQQFLGKVDKTTHHISTLQIKRNLATCAVFYNDSHLFTFTGERKNLQYLKFQNVFC